MGSSLVCRIRDHSGFEGLEERPLSPEARRAGLVRDLRVRFTGTPAAEAGLGQRPFHGVEVKGPPRRQPGGPTGRGGPEPGETLRIARDRLEVPVEVIALIDQHRWGIEIFFRFFKHVLGCRHRLGHGTHGIEIQVDVAIIACWLIAWWTQRQPTRRTDELIGFYFTGWASEEEWLAHLETRAPQA